MMPRRFARLISTMMHEADRDTVVDDGVVELRDRDDRGDARRYRHRDRQDVVDEDRRGRDERRQLAVVLAADDVRRAALRVRVDRLAVRRDDDRDQDRDTDRDRDELVEAELRGSSPAPTAVTNRISSVAYAVEEIASEEKTASATGLREPLVLLLGRSERATRRRSVSGCRTSSFRGRACPCRRASMPLRRCAGAGVPAVVASRLVRSAREARCTSS